MSHPLSIKSRYAHCAWRTTPGAFRDKRGMDIKTPTSYPSGNQVRIRSRPAVSALSNEVERLIGSIVRSDEFRIILLCDVADLSIDCNSDKHQPGCPSQKKVCRAISIPCATEALCVRGPAKFIPIDTFFASVHAASAPHIQNVP